MDPTLINIVLLHFNEYFRFSESEYEALGSFALPDIVYRQYLDLQAKMRSRNQIDSSLLGSSGKGQLFNLVTEYFEFCTENSFTMPTATETC